MGVVTSESMFAESVTGMPNGLQISVAISKSVLFFHVEGPGRTEASKRSAVRDRPDTEKLCVDAAPLDPAA